jgi:hypothetical protein
MDKKQFKKALEERLARRLQSETFDKITVGGSKMRFDMAMAINGYPFELPEGANEEYYSSLLTEQQYMSGQFDGIIDEVFLKRLKNLRKFYSKKQSFVGSRNVRFAYATVFRLHFSGFSTQIFPQK